MATDNQGLSALHRVLFRLNTHYHNTNVCVVGDFNSWTPGATPMADEDGDNVWETVIDLPSGRYEYKFLVDGKEYRADPENPLKGEREQFGNSLLLVGEARVEAEGDAVHTDKDLDVFCDRFMNVKAAINRKKFRDAALILRSGEREEIAGGYELYRDESYSYRVFTFFRAGAAAGAVLRYLFCLESEDGQPVYFGKNGLKKRMDEIQPFEFHTEIRGCFRTPEWVRDAVFYQIFPERFRNGNRKTDPPGTVPENTKPGFDTFYGGDLDGVIRSATYLKNLGVTAVYFNPLFESPSVHKYDTSDYRKIDPHFGTEETFRAMKNTLKILGIRFILDGVFNHTGDTFWAFRDVLANGPESAYKNWYVIRKFPARDGPENNYESWWGFPSLPKLNAAEPAVKKHLLETASHWIEKGASGWRLDVPNEIDHPFWKEFRRTVKTTDPDAYIVGEIWQDARPWLSGDEFDGVMNYRFRDACLNFFGRRLLRAPDFAAEIGKLVYRYPLQACFANLNLLSSHDTARYFSVIGKDLTRMKLSVAFQFSFPGAPCVYYGEENGMEGGRDPDNRRFMVWDRGKWNGELRRFYGKMIGLRRRIELLRRGDFRFIRADGMVVGFERFRIGEKIAVFLNNGDTSESIDPAPLFPKSAVVDHVSGRSQKPGRPFVLEPGGILVLDRK